MSDHIIKSEVRKTNNKFHAQKYITIPKINVFKNSENGLKTSFTIKHKLKPQNNSSSQQFITSNKRSYDSQIGCKSLKGSQRNDMNKRIRHSHGVSTSSLKLSTSKLSTSTRRPDQKQSTSSQKRVDLATPSSQQNPHSTKQKVQVILPQHTQPSARQGTLSESSKSWTRFQTKEQQLEIMMYWLDTYYKHNRFDPAISDLKSGKPWNEIEGKLLTQFMPVFKHFLKHNSITSRDTDFYRLFFMALQNMHRDATKAQDDD